MNRPSVILNARGIKVSAKAFFEVQVDLSGTFQPGYPATGPSYSSGGDPAEPDAMEDVEIVRIGGLKRELSPPEIRGSHMWTDRFVDLLEGVDAKSEAYQKIIANVMKFLGNEAEQELLGEVEWED